MRFVRLPFTPLLLALLPLGLLLATGCAQDPDAPSFARVTLLGEECLDEAVACGEVCTTVASDPNHCGRCDRACEAGFICNLGSCRDQSEGCSEALSLCDRGCVNSATDRNHCGTCGNVCPAEGECLAGRCECPGELEACGDECVDLQTDEANCGACGQGCVDAQTCERGSCECPLDQTLCGESCTDVDSDADNCGACGQICEGGQICGGGECACPQGTTLCDGVCVDTSTDADNCGQCGNVCTGGQVCGESACACPTGQALCDELCIDVQIDDDNCGGCGIGCGLGESCGAGSCRSGALGEDGCQGLAQNLSIGQIAAYQTIKVELAADGELIEQRRSEVIAGRPTLVRVFVEPGEGWAPRELSARLHLGQGEEERTEYSRSRLTIAGPSDEEDRESTFEFQLAPEVVAEQTRFAVEVVECNGAADAASAGAPQPSAEAAGAGAGGANPELGLPNPALGPVETGGLALGARFPASDGADLGVIATGALRVHFVPVRANGELPDTSDETLAFYESAFLATYPVGRVLLSVGEPVDIQNAEDWGNTLDTVRALRQQEAPDPDVYYYGLVRPTERFGQFCGGACTAGVGYVPAGRFQAASQRVSVGLAYGDARSAFTMLHEIGHNHGRSHSPCVPPGGSIVGVDGNYPYAGGVIGAYGYSAVADSLIPPDQATDVMGYCPNQWFSDFTYNGLLQTSLAVNSVLASEQVPAARVGAWRVLLWDATHGSRWGAPIPGPAAASGVEEVATVLDASGAPIQSVSVYRTLVGDLGYSVQVPEPAPGWHAIEVAGAAPLAY